MEILFSADFSLCEIWLSQDSEVKSPISDELHSDFSQSNYSSTNSDKSFSVNFF